MKIASDDSRIIKEVELWETSTRKVEELLPKEERPIKGAIVIAYSPRKNEGIMHFMYEERTIKISIVKKNETDYILSHKGKTLLAYKRETKVWVYFHFFRCKDEMKKDLSKRISFQESDAAYNKKSTESIEELLERMREQAKFAEEEQKAFDQDPPYMMKGGE
jgi:hypothetical protein